MLLCISIYVTKCCVTACNEFNTMKMKRQQKRFTASTIVESVNPPCFQIYVHSTGIIACKYYTFYISLIMMRIATINYDSKYS